MLTSVSVYYYTNSIYLYSLQVTDTNGLQGTKVPSNSGATGSLAATVSLSSSKWITEFKVWQKPSYLTVGGTNSCGFVGNPWTQL